MRYTFLFLFIVGLPQLSFTQNCYELFLNKGKAAFDQLQFEDAINQFQAAQVCDDKPSDDTEINQWITKTQTGYIDAIKKARDEALKLKSEAEALRFFVKGQEREFKGFYLEAMDYFTEAINLQPTDTLFRERRAQLAMSEEVNEFLIAKQDLLYLIENGSEGKKSEYYDDLAYVNLKLNDFDAAIVAQTSASNRADMVQAPIYNEKVKNLESRNVKDLGIGDPNAKATNATIRLNNQKGQPNCGINIRFNINGKSLKLKEDIIKLEKLPPGTYQYEITGTVACPGSNEWPAIGKGTITVRPNTVYYLYWEQTKYGKCDMWVNNY